MAFQMAHSKPSTSRNIGLLMLIGALALYAAALLIPSRTSSVELFAAAPATPFVPTDVTHIAFAILGSRKSRSRRPLVEMWWRPNKTRGVMWLEPSQQEENWPSTSPPYRVFEEGVPVPLQMRKVMEETLAAVQGTSPRWVVFGDDDTVFFVENLVEVLRRYDHDDFYYIGGESESAIQNSRYYGMAFGGGGVALSTRLVKAILPVLDNCLKRYQSFYILDQILYSCISEIGVPLTREQGFHQVDLRGNISGFLSAHPQAPVVSLHHVEVVDPYFPSMSREKSMRQLMRAAEVDSSRLLQQSFCYERGLNWTMAVSFGYSVHVHEQAVEPRVLQIPLQSFKAWRKSMPQFTFEARQWWREPCLAPHLFYLHAVSSRGDGGVVSEYRRHSPGDLPACGNHSANDLSRITVLTPKNRRSWIGSRRECCQVTRVSKGSTKAVLRVSPCIDGQTIY